MQKMFILTILSTLTSLCGCGGSTASKDLSQNTAQLQAVKHILIMMQENETFDRYFGQLNRYRQLQGLSQDVDGTPANASQLAYDGSVSFTPFHMRSMCTEDLSSYWNESHNDWNRSAPTSGTPTLDGFAYSAGSDSRNSNPAGADINGQRVMGYYDETDLPYYYFMATRFAISDRWFSAVMTNTSANRMYAVAATSHGVISNPSVQVNIPTIFDELQDAGVTWKDYVQDYPTGSSLQPFSAYAKYVGTNIVPIANYFNDLNNGTLPQVAFIERNAIDGKDEHPGAGSSVQKGAAYVASIMNALMNSTAWGSSVFFLVYDEGGGFYDHVPPAQTVSPDMIPPVLGPNDICATTPGATCDFVYTGFRIPNIVVSPFSKKGYVDHTPIDTTAILRFIEIRYGLPSLTKRDAAQPDISFFFNFADKPNLTSPPPPDQPLNGPCYTNSLP